MSNMFNLSIWTQGPKCGIILSGKGYKLPVRFFSFSIVLGVLSTEWQRGHKKTILRAVFYQRRHLK